MAKQMNEEIETLKEQVKQMSKQLEKIGKSSQDELPDEVRSYLDSASNKARDQWETTKEQVKQSAGDLHQYAQQNPWHVASLAAVAGFLAAALSIHKDRK